MKVNKEEIRRMYHVDGLSTHDIAKKLNVSQSTVRHHLKGTQLRSRSEAQKKYLQTHDHQRKGERHSEEAKNKISIALKGKKRHGSSKEEKADNAEAEVESQELSTEERVVQAP